MKAKLTPFKNTWIVKFVPTFSNCTYTREDVEYGEPVTYLASWTLYFGIINSTACLISDIGKYTVINTSLFALLKAVAKLSVFFHVKLLFNVLIKFPLSKKTKNFKTCIEPMFDLCYNSFYFKKRE